MCRIGSLSQVIPVDLEGVLTVCSRPEDGLMCRLGVKPPLKTQNYVDFMEVTMGDIPKLIVWIGWIGIGWNLNNNVCMAWGT